MFPLLLLSSAGNLLYSFGEPSTDSQHYQSLSFSHIFPFHWPPTSPRSGSFIASTPHINSIAFAYTFHLPCSEKQLSLASLIPTSKLFSGFLALVLHYFISYCTPQIHEPSLSFYSQKLTPFYMDFLTRYIT